MALVCIYRWAHDNWQVFERFAERLGLPCHTCIRRPSSMLNSGTLRCEHQHVGTTCFVLYLVCNTCAHARDEGKKCAATTFLHEVFKRFLGQVDFQVNMVMDTDTFCWPGKALEEDHAVEVPIDHGMVSVVPFLEGGAMPLPSRKQLMRLLEGEHFTLQAAVPLHTFCIILFKGGKQLAWLARQFLITVAMAMDAMLDEMCLPSKFVDAGGKIPIGRRPDLEIKEEMLVEYGAESKETMEKLSRQHGLRMSWAPRAQRRMLAKYLVASRRHSSMAPRISIAMDASRLGGRDALCGVLIFASPGDGKVRAAWTPPQALSKHVFARKPKVSHCFGLFRFLSVSSGMFRKVPESFGKFWK